MLGIGSKNPPVDKIETLIGANTTFQGRLVCDGNVRIDGICEEGVIETVGNIVVGVQAKVAADLIADNVSVSGVVTGNITASGRLEVIGNGQVWGDARVSSIFVDDEADFHGKLIKGDKEAPPAFGLAQTEAPELDTPPVSEPEAGPGSEQTETLSS
jgi:cytoskeletal protein CcmA (bactofilin family)